MRQENKTIPSFSVLLPALMLVACAGTKDSSLRLRRVVLYQNGIGYFEHTGHADSDRLRIPMRRFELDDALKTLTVIRSENGKETPRHGTVHVMTGDAADANKKSPDDQRKVGMDVQVPGARSEDLKITYSVPTPIWKATYRVVFGKEKSDEALLQGWAAIQNTSGHDWHDVSLTLATGAPLSFGVDLTRPVYASRPDANGTMRSPVATGVVRASRTRPGDEDGDGIPDASDMCRSSAEDLDGFEDADGCPDPDNDHDSILDVDDLCPTESETHNGLDDDDGCPDRGRVIVTENNLSILDKIYFGANSANISERSRPIVDAIAATLLGNPQIAVVEVAGHAASNEKEVWKRSEERAISVAASLKKLGILSTRLRVRSFGDSNPLDPGSNAEAHAKNRRAEFTILQTKEPQSSTASVSRASKKARTTRVAVPKASARGGMVHYTLPATVSIPDGESTLLPLVNTLVKGEEIYLYRPESSLPGSDQYPSRTARIVNNGELALVPGPVAVFARDAFAGEGLLDSLNPGESAFIPFALDRSATVSVKENRSQRPKRIASIVEGMIGVVDEHQITTEYTIGVGITPPSRAFVQHKGHAGYKLSAPPGSEQLANQTLVPIRLSGGRSATLRLRELTERKRNLSVAHASATEIRSYLVAHPLPDAVSKKIERVLALRAQIRLHGGNLDALRSQRLDDQIRARQIRLNLKALSKDQGPLRESLKKELTASVKRSGKLASEVAVLSEGLSKHRIELQVLIADLKLKPS